MKSADGEKYAHKRIYNTLDIHIGVVALQIQTHIIHLQIQIQIQIQICTYLQIHIQHTRYTYWGRGLRPETDCPSLTSGSRDPARIVRPEGGESESDLIYIIASH